MTGWHRGRLGILDTETTGVDVETDRVVTVTVGMVGGGQPTDVHSWIVDPGVPIPDGAARIHGVTTERAQAEGAPPADVLAEVAFRLAEVWDTGAPLIAYNAAFDLTILDRELRRHRGTGLTLAGPVVDPFVIDREVDKYRKGKRTLTVTCEHYGVRLDGAHDATQDALAAARVAWALANRYPVEVGDVPLPVLHERQVAWHAARQADFAAYLTRTGKDASDVHGAWPLRPHAQAVAA